jgi:hypothetical protein
VIVDAKANTIHVLADDGIRTKSGDTLGQVYLNNITGNMRFGRVFERGLKQQWGLEDLTDVAEYKANICCGSCKDMFIKACERGF